MHRYSAVYGQIIGPWITARKQIYREIILPFRYRLLNRKTCLNRVKKYEETKKGRKHETDTWTRTRINSDSNRIANNE